MGCGSRYIVRASGETGLVRRLGEGRGTEGRQADCAVSDMLVSATPTRLSRSFGAACGSPRLQVLTDGFLPGKASRHVHTACMADWVDDILPRLFLLNGEGRQSLAWGKRPPTLMPGSAAWLGAGLGNHSTVSRSSGRPRITDCAGCRTRHGPFGRVVLD